jgi:hypothetical protein
VGRRSLDLKLILAVGSQFQGGLQHCMYGQSDYPVVPRQYTGRGAAFRLKLTKKQRQGS